MNIANTIRQHVAALRALLVLTVILGFGYPLLIWLIAFIPGLHDKAEGSIITIGGKPVGSRLIGQSFTDASGNPLPKYFQSRPSAAGSNGYDPTSSGGSNLGPESIVDTPGDPAKLASGASASDAGFKPSLLTQVCTRSVSIGQLEGVNGARPFCTGGGVGAVLSVIGPRDSRGYVVHPTRVVSVNEPCATTKQPFLDFYEGVRVECAKFGDDYSNGQIVPIGGAAAGSPQVPADAVTASGSGLDPNISPAYAAIQVTRVAKARHVSPDQIRAVLAQFSDGRALGFFGEPTVNVLQLNAELDHRFPATS
ncbi:potassium-transporting ATPase subunit C [Mycobacterium montefiorense]|uniref:Potassium-transporting ATPase KdpC subunit n=1 Tax=Mycobacterium montefiorense TaxID=154654 RepID=A0AA37PQE6_9MYCO|nr:potassium-transporting ATPase subunit C [Mycobacterium montefiorense]GBG39344.1 potassium-transporting ATPase KdpC subunit [Mycobacterium montefiorense]GKU37459.1 potassium-transporting ATPase KdpC subunit [Mycobacterium montefiorense]GKU42314.1 potassium-transporting ATPase KdpC subunit [Mycobacterium montefiorense]GKU44246.1 potassium-transporting ATPase KdpC subunit [Mycobacterium montefiorense]GKU53239.1 potassium-transporting ATPase KdpC subunit [Mycobacterium montefiorense]